jgi:hypothetical protein
MKSTTGGDRTARARTAAGSISIAAAAVTAIIVIVRATTAGGRPGCEWVSRSRGRGRGWRSATHQQQR